MKTFKRYVLNQAYVKGFIVECFLMNESMMYTMNYMPMVQKEVISKDERCGPMLMVNVPTLLIKMERSTVLITYNTSKHVDGY